MKYFNEYKCNLSESNDIDWDDFDEEESYMDVIIGDTYLCIKTWMRFNNVGFAKGKKYKLINIMKEPDTYVLDSMVDDDGWVDRQYFYPNKYKFSDYFRKDLNENFDFDDDDFDYEEEYYDDNKNILTEKNMKIGQKVICIKNCTNVNRPQQIKEVYPIFAGDVKIIKNFNVGNMLHDDIVWFNDTIVGIGSYKCENFKQLNTNENFEWNDDDFDFEEESPSKIPNGKPFEFYKQFVGKKVTLNKTSPYYKENSLRNPADMPGTIRELNDDGDTHFFIVAWDNNKLRNYYRPEDLILL